MKCEFDALVMTTARDYQRLRKNYHRLVKNMPARRLLFVGSKEVESLVREDLAGSRVGFVNEEQILPMAEVHGLIEERMKELLGGQPLPRGITGWYYQQFLKMQYAEICEDPNYLVWDGDTIPCRPFSMFYKEEMPFFDMKKEFHQEYFSTLSRILPNMRKCIEKSFISEHMLINCEIMKSLIGEIEKNRGISGNKFWEKIIYAIDSDKIQECSFSEFETYGTYVCYRYPTAYRLRNWYSFRQGGEFFDPDTISDEDYEWLGHDFDAISFEKGHFVREDHKNIFDNRNYQQKLSARKMLETAQMEYKEGYRESWDDLMQSSNIL